jgi:AcrR family transcriptional regulator
MQQRSEETKAKIMEAAYASFGRDGYEATGVAEICSAAGVSKGAFYHHFPSKQAVFMAILENWLAILDPQLAEILENARDVPTGLIRMAAMTRFIFQSADGRLPMFFEFWTQSSRDPKLWEIAVAPYRRYQQLFADTIRRGIAEGSLRPVDADSAARALLSLVIGCLLQGLLDPIGADWEQVTRDSVQLFLSGITITQGNPGEK